MKTYIIYDSRAAFGDTDEATVYETCNSLKEAREDVRDMFPDGVIFEYDLVNGEAINERMIPNKKGGK